MRIDSQRTNESQSCTPAKEPQNGCCITHTHASFSSSCISLKCSSAAIVGTGHTAFANNGNKTKGFKNDGISLPANTKQNQECQTAGGISPITGVEKIGSYTAVSTNAVTNLGGSIGEVMK